MTYNVFGGTLNLLSFHFSFIAFIVLIVLTKIHSQPYLLNCADLHKYHQQNVYVGINVTMF